MNMIKRSLKIGVIVIALAIVSLLAFVHLAPVQATNMALAAERNHSGLERKEITTPDGLHYAYLEGGQGAPLILIHGFGANKDNFTRVARWLTPHYRVIIPDLIGFGESSHPEDADYSAKAQAVRLRGFAHALGIEKVDIGGNSMGGQIAMFWAVQFPAEVNSMWLIDAAGIWSAPKSELARLVVEQGRNPLVSKNEAEFDETYAFVMTDPPFIPHPMLNVLAQEPIKNYDLAQKIFKRIALESVESEITGSTIPALITWGDEDRAITVATADILHKLLPRSEVAIIHHAGHLPMVEQPRRCAEDYLRFRANEPAALKQ
ncbi:MAG TPA: alpha/beta hydrolase [Burkholderiaceae bacterium]